ncbi:MAG TPA: Lrp/AsnC ligand binding domain-containing protein [Candidatus Nanoarchaeia archaeon]|nr:Lrp/AsnC ligand binding domain-containing protein [Candidatus Nanoarchaeia archaeon]
MIKEKNISEIHPLFGEYDLIAKVIVHDFDQLGDIVFNKICKIEGHYCAHQYQNFCLIRSKIVY